MNIISIILTVLVAVLFFYIMYLETISTDSDSTGRVFNIAKEELQRPSLNTLFKNQGVYNGLIGVGLLYGTFFSKNLKEIVGLLLVYIILVAIYGGLTSDKKNSIKARWITNPSFNYIIILERYKHEKYSGNYWCYWRSR